MLLGLMNWQDALWIINLEELKHKSNAKSCYSDTQITNVSVYYKQEPAILAFVIKN